MDDQSASRISNFQAQFPFRQMLNTLLLGAKIEKPASPTPVGGTIAY